MSTMPGSLSQERDESRLMELTSGSAEDSLDARTGQNMIARDIFTLLRTDVNI